jgi:hypothetical protein
VKENSVLFTEVRVNVEIICMPLITWFIDSGELEAMLDFPERRFDCLSFQKNDFKTWFI